MKAVTTKEISGLCIPTILVGTAFEIIHLGDAKTAYSTCSGLPVSRVWNDEFVLVPRVCAGAMTLNLQSKRGDIIECDVGYNGMIDMQPCKVLDAPTEDSPLFPNSRRTCSARVEITGTGETFTTQAPI